MRLTNRLLASGIALGFLMCLAYGCGSSKPEEKAVVEEVNAETDRRQLIEAAISRLPDWVDYWKRHGFTGDPSVFALTQTSPIENLERPEMNPLLKSGSPLEQFQISHPEGLGLVDIYDYKVRINEDGETLYEPDSEVIFYKANGMRERLLFIGPSGLFEDAAWIDGNHLVVAGYFEGDAGFSPVLWIVSLDRGSYEMYESTYTNSEYPRHGYLEEKLNPTR